MNEALQTGRDVRIIATEIRTLTMQSKRMLLDYAIEIGRRLCEAKEQLSHGEWGDYLRNEIHYSQSSANNHINVYREYGEAQGSLFGAAAKSQTYGDLTYTKALALLVIPEESREAFIVENNVEDMSTRELNRLIKERDAALKEKELAQAAKDKAEEDAAEQRRRTEETESRIRDAQSEAERKQEEMDRLREELNALQETAGTSPTEPDPSLLDAARKEAADKARKEAEEALRKKIAKVDAAKQKAEEECRAAQAERDAIKQENDKVKEENERALQRAELEHGREKATMSDQIAALEKQLKTSGSQTVTAFKLHFETAQGAMNKMLHILQSLDGEEAELAPKLVGALTAMCARAMETAGAAGGTGDNIH